MDVYLLARILLMRNGCTKNCEPCWRTPPEAADFGKLPFLHAVMSEVLRMYPPAYITARTSIEPSQIGGYDFPAGTTMLMSQW